MPKLISQPGKLTVGDLNRRVSFGRKLYGPGGDDLGSLDPLGDAWASIEPGVANPIGSRAEDMRSGRDVSISEFRVRMRYERARQLGLSNSSVMTYNAENYEVREIIDFNTEHRVVILTCRLIH